VQHLGGEGLTRLLRIPDSMIFLLGLLRQALRTRGRRAAPGDLALTFAITRLLLDAGYAEAAGGIVVARWRTAADAAFEVICAERVQLSLSGLLGAYLSRPFRVDAGGWLLTQAEADRLIALSR
jgi:hypothetical protein